MLRVERMVNKWGGQTKYDYNGKVIEEGITIDEIFEEVPIRIHNSALVSSPPQPLANDELSGERGGVCGIRPTHRLASPTRSSNAARPRRGAAMSQRQCGRVGHGLPGGSVRAVPPRARRSSGSGGACWALTLACARR